MSQYKQHVKKWRDCTECELCEKRKKVVLFRGSVPCDVLFIGEAPGPSEDAIGQPFIGPAGHNLDEYILMAGARACITLRLGFTNLVACIPKGEDNKKFKEPDRKYIEACEQRLNEIVNLCQPEAIVAVGKLAQKYLWQCVLNTEPLYREILHPAAIMRLDVSQKGLAVQRVVATLTDLFVDVDNARS